MESAAIESGWLKLARKIPSPNFYALSEREVSLLVIHNISLPPGEFGGPYIHALFTNSLNPAAHPYLASVSSLRVSAHLLIDRGGIVTQYVSFTDCAHHAGESMHNGRARCNDFSIGIELEGTDDLLYTDEQYTSLARATNVLRREYPKITMGNIVGHSDIAPARKSDPGPSFDWARYRGALEA